MLRRQTETWLYGLAFLAVVAAGALFVLPRLRPPPPSPDGYPEPFAPPESAEPEAGRSEPGVASLLPKPQIVEVEIAAAQGALRGPLRPVHGARVEALSPPSASRPRLRLEVQAPAVFFGAVGHEWVGMRASALRQGMRITLPAAADPVVVRVVDARGDPAADVPVFVVPSAPGPPPRTDESGALVLDWLPSGPVLLDLRSAEARGPLLLVDSEAKREVRAVLDPLWTVKGRLRDPSGQLLSDAQVQGLGPTGVWGRATRTDARGAFVWRGPPIARLALRLEAEGLSPLRLDVRPPSRGALESDVGEVRLARAAGTITGRIQASWIAPDAHVAVEPAVAAVFRELYGSDSVLNETFRVPLGADGTFRMEGLEAQIPLRLMVRGAGLPLDHVVTAPGGEAVELALSTLTGEVLEGRLTDGQGEPLPSVPLYLSSERREESVAVVGDVVLLSAADGRFRHAGLPAGRWFVRASAVGAGVQTWTIDLPSKEPVHLRLDEPPLETTTHLRGIVTDATGAPLAGIPVLAGWASDRTDRAGRFAVEGVRWSGPLVDVLCGPAAGGQEDGASEGTKGKGATPHWIPRLQRVAPGGGDLSIVLREGGQLRARVLEGISLEPISFAQVLAMDDAGDEVLVDLGLATAGGEITLTHLPAGGLRLWIFTESRAWTGTAVVRAGDVTDLGDILLKPGLTVAGTVLTLDGKPVEGAHVSALPPPYLNRGPAVERESLLRQATSDAEGRFRLEGFLRGRLRDRAAGMPEDLYLAVWAEGYAPVALKVQADLISERSVSVEAHLRRGAFLGARVEEAQPIGSPTDPVPIHGALIDLQNARDGSRLLDLWQWAMVHGALVDSVDWERASRHLLQEQADRRGYLVGPVEPGPYEVVVHHPAYKPFRQRLTIPDPQQVIIDLVDRLEVARFVFPLHPAD